MDDNHRLSEWIAYHYFAMPSTARVVTTLIHLRSRTSRKGLDRWRPVLIDNITLYVEAAHEKTAQRR
jgi:hypothetical protein